MNQTAQLNNLTSNLRGCFNKIEVTHEANNKTVLRVDNVNLTFNFNHRSAKVKTHNLSFNILNVSFENFEENNKLINLINILK